MDETFEERLAAVERALTDGDHDCSSLAEGAATAERVTALEAEMEELTDRVAELEASTQALRGYVGNVRSVNEEVEQRADTALEKAETAHRIAAAGDTPNAAADRDTRTKRCERPLAETSRDDSSQSSAGEGRSRLDELAENTSQNPQRGGLSGAPVGAETDGGHSYLDDDSETATGLLARIRDLI